MILTVGETIFSFFFFNDTATTEIYTLSLHDALPIYQAAIVAWYRRFYRPERMVLAVSGQVPAAEVTAEARRLFGGHLRSEEHTSELQSQSNLVCRLLLEKKKTTPTDSDTPPQHNHSH